MFFKKGVLVTGFHLALKRHKSNSLQIKQRVAFVGRGGALISGGDLLAKVMFCLQVDRDITGGKGIDGHRYIRGRNYKLQVKECVHFLKLDTLWKRDTCNKGLIENLCELLI